MLRGITHGAVDFLTKPVRMEDLRNLWQHVVRQRRESTTQGGTVSEGNMQPSGVPSGLPAWAGTGGVSSGCGALGSGHGGGDTPGAEALQGTQLLSQPTQEALPTQEAQLPAPARKRKENNAKGSDVGVASAMQARLRITPRPAIPALGGKPEPTLHSCFFFSM